VPIEGPFAVDLERSLRTYVVLWRAAKTIFDQEKNIPDADRCMVVGTLLAFSFEAYLNHVGAGLLDSWDDVEQKLGWRPKLSLLAELLQLKIDLGRRPADLLPRIFRFRDAIAHGKTKPVRLPDQPMPEAEGAQLDDALFAMIEKATAEWERACQPTTISLWMGAVEQMIKQLHVAFLKHRKLASRDMFEAEPADPFSSRSRGSASVKVSRGPVSAKVKRPKK
jgi:hypothetical protein